MWQRTQASEGEFQPAHRISYFIHLRCRMLGPFGPIKDRKGAVIVAHYAPDGIVYRQTATIAAVKRAGEIVEIVAKIPQAIGPRAPFVLAKRALGVPRPLQLAYHLDLGALMRMEFEAKSPKPPAPAGDKPLRAQPAFPRQTTRGDPVPGSARSCSRWSATRSPVVVDTKS